MNKIKFCLDSCEYWENHHKYNAYCGDFNCINCSHKSLPSLDTELLNKLANNLIETLNSRSYDEYEVWSS